MSRKQEPALRHEVMRAYLGGKRRLPLLKEETWRNAAGEVTRYSLAYVDPATFPRDNGRVLGYDNAHGRHHRHYLGEEMEFGFIGYEQVVARFEAEVAWLRKGLWLAR